MRGGQRGQMEQVLLTCDRCGAEAFIWRRKCKLKEPDHVKHLWCHVCQERTPHREVR